MKHSNQDVIWTKDVNLVDGDSKVDGKQRGITQIRLKHDLKQQQDLDLGQKLNTTNSETELCKGYGADGFRLERNMAVDYGTKAKIELKDRYKPNSIPEALITK